MVEHLFPCQKILGIGNFGCYPYQASKQVLFFYEPYASREHLKSTEQFDFLLPECYNRDCVFLKVKLMASKEDFPSVITLKIFMLSG